MQYAQPPQYQYPQPPQVRTSFRSKVDASVPRNQAVNLRIVWMFAFNKDFYFQVEAKIWP